MPIPNVAGNDPDEKLKAYEEEIERLDLEVSDRNRAIDKLDDAIREAGRNARPRDYLKQVKHASIDADVLLTLVNFL